VKARKKENDVRKGKRAFQSRETCVREEVGISKGKKEERERSLIGERGD